MLAQVEKENMDHSEVEVIEDFGTGYFVPYQRALWDLFEKPQSSHSAKMISLLSTGRNNSTAFIKTSFSRSCAHLYCGHVSQHFSLDAGAEQMTLSQIK